ncbi:serine protease inhibitor 2.1-like [Lacerta agilis]|uniref:serine protease inhibitor 2.1-like n=1 Tax=Lacerta agilis TaxID=80427 RepID=UPI00141961AC|nr:serine protease inhibitor 2.1-like [Lacerta agilis]
MKPATHLSLLLIVLQVHNGHGGKDPIQEKLASSIVDFAFKFSKHVTSHQGAKNILFSPVSISMAFSALGLGAKSKTQNQIYSGLGLTTIDTSKIHAGFQELLKVLTSSKKAGKVNLGNVLYLTKGIKIATKYNKDLQNFYKSEIFAVDFKDNVVAEKQINDYVKKKTRGKITKMVKNLAQDTSMFLGNYVYFKDNWENPFEARFTWEEPFFVDEKTTLKVKMMRKTETVNYLHDEHLSCWLVELPYRGGAVAWFVLPDKGKLKTVEDALGQNTLARWKTTLQQGEISLHLPKFLMSTSYDLKDLLSRMGITEVFTNKADLSGITGTGSRNLMVSTASHKAVLDVNERGTEAAAVSFGSQVTGASPNAPRPVLLKFDRPFFLFIWAPDDGVMLFMGKIVNPLQA